MKPKQCDAKQGKMNRLDINIGCGRAILSFFLGAAVFVVAVGLMVVVVLWLIFLA